MTIVETRPDMGVLDGATVREFSIPGVGVVCVEIGDVVYTDPILGHAYPRYRVCIDGEPVLSGEDWGVPRHRAVDCLDSMLDLLFWVGYERDEEGLSLWVHDRRELRDAITAPGVYWRDAVARWKAERGM